MESESSNLHPPHGGNPQSCSSNVVCGDDSSTEIRPEWILQSEGKIRELIDPRWSCGNGALDIWRSQDPFLKLLFSWMRLTGRRLYIKFQNASRKQFSFSEIKRIFHNHSAPVSVGFLNDLYVLGLLNMQRYYEMSHPSKSQRRLIIGRYLNDVVIRLYIGNLRLADEYFILRLDRSSSLEFKAFLSAITTKVKLHRTNKPKYANYEQNLKKLRNIASLAKLETQRASGVGA